MKIIYLTGIVFGLLALAACSEESAAPDVPKGDIPVGFLTDVTQTRGTEYNGAADLSDIGVFACFTNGEFNANTSIPNFMYNQQVNRQTDGSWTYSPMKYWPNNDEDKISFFAYAPHCAAGANGLAVSTATKAGFPTLTYTVPTTEADQIDLLAATPLMNRTYSGTGGSVNFTMKHTLTKVKFSIKSEIDIKVTSLTINAAPKTGTLTFTDSGFNWGSYTGTQTFTATLVGGGTDVTANAADAQTLATFFLLPNKANATFSIGYTQKGTQEVQLNKNNIALTSAWEQGGSLNYQLNVKKDGSMTATVAQDWTPDNGGNMSGKEKGIGSAVEWVAFAKLWNANGLPVQSDGITPDYTLYEDYGWYETSGTSRTFTIKLTSSFVLTGTTTGELYMPVGTDTRPLTLPIDGQGWEIDIDLQNNSQRIEGKYSGIVGYTQSGISNLRVVTIPGNSVSTGYSIESSDATYAGVLAGKVDGDILNCSVELTKTTVINSNPSATTAMYLGGLVGYCSGNIRNSAVYEGSSSLSASVVSFSKASSGSGIGGLAGGVASGKAVGNCYVRLSTLSNQAGDTPAAGWLAGSKAGAVFSTCYYMTGNTATGCTPDDSSAGITSFTDFTGLCALLNAEADKHTGWALWKEVTDTGGTVQQVTLDLYR